RTSDSTEGNVTSSPGEPLKQGYVAAENRLYPVDEAPQDASLLAFRERLLTSVRKHDGAAVLRAVDLRIRVSFGDDNGRKAFSKQWKLDEQDSPFWHVMEKILVNGGSFQEPAATPRRLIAPYVYSRWPEAIDSFENLAVVSSKARMRSKPDGPEIGTLHYEIVKIANDPGRKGVADSPWRHVVTTGGASAWLAADDLYSPVGYRAFFEKTPEGWMLTTLVAGD
ncbi:MAG: hypothetical protein ABI718_18845, partial [Acidobacteriota bacterium]